MKQIWLSYRYYMHTCQTVSIVMLTLLAVHSVQLFYLSWLPQIFKDPDTYDPDRFAPGREEDKAAGAFSYISFGGGRHGCLGEPFGYLQIKAIWSHLRMNFEFELISPFPENDRNAMVMGVKGEVIVRYKRRKLADGN